MKMKEVRVLTLLISRCTHYFPSRLAPWISRQPISLI